MTALAWRAAHGTGRDELAGCLDVDLRATPYSNTMPVRRLGLDVGASATIHVVDYPGLFHRAG